MCYIHTYHEPQVGGISLQNPSVGHLVIAHCLTLIVDIKEFVADIHIFIVKLHKRSYSDGIFTFSKENVHVKDVRSFIVTGEPQALFTVALNFTG